MRMSDNPTRNVALSNAGCEKIEWSSRRMPVLKALSEEAAFKKLFSNCVVAACLHVTPETAVLMRALKSGGAEIFLCGSNPLSTQDDVVMALARQDKMQVYACRGITNKQYNAHINSVIKNALSAALTNNKAVIIIDDGADLIAAIHKMKVPLDRIIGASEETTTGVNRLKAMEKDGALRFPVVAVNDSATKHLFDNKYGTGQSALDGVIRATNILMAGKSVVVVGYGPCGEGVARCAKGLGAHVIVCEVNPIRALQAHYDGFTVGSMDSAAGRGDIFITVTGQKSVIDAGHFAVMKDGAVLANAGHFDCEINLADLKVLSEKTIKRGNLTEYDVAGRKILVIGEGRLVNLVAAAGHPAEVMDMSFATQFEAARYLLEERGKLPSKIHELPEKEQQSIASLKLKTLGVEIDSLTNEQEKYLTSWHSGT